MSEPNDLDPIGRLRAANPIPADQVPDASLARVSAKVQEHIMSNEENPSRPIGRWRWVALAGGAAVTGVLVIAVATGGLSGQRPGIAANPTATPALAVVPTAAPPTAAPARTAEPTTAPATPTDPATPDGGGGMAMCLAYDPGFLPNFDVVFDGTVTAIDGDQVTFAVNEGWKNAAGSVTLTVPDTSIALTGPVPGFHVGDRYLVSGSDGKVSTCGFSIVYGADEAAAWAAAFSN